MRTSLVVLDWYPTVLHAEIVKGRLEEAGIRVVLADDTESAAGGAVAYPPYTTIRLLVPECELDRARRLVSTPVVRPAPDG